MIQQKYTIKREKGKHLTLIERGKIEAYSNAGYSKSKIAQLIDKNSSYVALENAKKKGLDVNISLKIITSDNESEFMNAKAIEDLGIEYFYAHSYCSGERGSNENNNKLIRRHIAKGMDIRLKSEEEVRKIEECMNTYPRNLFNGKSSIEIYFEELRKYFS